MRDWEKQEMTQMYAPRQRVLFLFTLFSSASAMQLALLFALQITCTFRMCLLSAKPAAGNKSRFREAALCRIIGVTSIFAGRCVCACAQCTQCAACTSHLFRVKKRKCSRPGNFVGHTSCQKLHLFFVFAF